MTDSLTYDVIILGGGVAGLSAALYASRDGFNTLVIEGDFVSNTQLPGGALLLTPDIENYPGFKGGEGSELIDIIRGQAESFGATIQLGLAETVAFTQTEGDNHTITLNDGTVVTSKTVIIASGAVARQLNVPGEVEFIGRGISTCATCDGFFFKDKKVIVVGGGDTAIEDALFLMRYSSDVTLVVRGDTLRASGPDARKALALNEEEDSGFSILWNTQVEEIYNNTNQVSGVRYNTGEVEDVDGVFVAIGRDPSTQFLLETASDILDSEGYVKTLDNSTSVGYPGVFAAGDVADKKFRQAATSVGKAVEAALEAREYLNRNK